jgi:hypothetical protein
MDINKIIAELHSKRHDIDQAIAVLEQVGGRRRRGRPPKWMSQAVNEKRPPLDRKRKPIAASSRS